MVCLQVQQVQYNLQLLRAMLEVSGLSLTLPLLLRDCLPSLALGLQVSAVEGKVDQDTYSHVIRLWVKDVRDRSNQQAAPSLEVSQLSDSEVRVNRVLVCHCLCVDCCVCVTGGGEGGVGGWREH